MGYVHFCTCRLAKLPLLGEPSAPMRCLASGPIVWPNFPFPAMILPSQALLASLRERIPFVLLVPL